MDEDRLALARLRAGGTALVSDPEALASAAARAGRRVVAIRADPRGTVVTLGWPDDADLSPETWPVTVRELPATTLLTFAACLGCCWPDAPTDPYPGRTVPVATILRAVRSRGLDERWTKGALHDLVKLGFVARESDEIRLGAGVARLPRSDVALLRRGHASLPVEVIP